MPIADGSNYQQKTKSSKTLLHLIARFNSTDVAWLLADNGAKITLKTEKILKHHLIANVTALKVKHLLLLLQVEEQLSSRGQSEENEHIHFSNSHALPWNNQE